MSFLDYLHNLLHGTRPKHNSDIDAHAPSSEHVGADVDALAGAIERAGMSVPAALALEVGKPLSWLGGQVLWVFQPFADVLGMRARKGPLSVEGVARMLERDGSTEALLKCLDARTTSRDRGGRR